MTEDEVFDNNDDLDRAESPLSSDDVEFVIDEWNLITEGTNVDAGTAAFIFGEDDVPAPADVTAGDPMESLFDGPKEDAADVAGRRTEDSDISGLGRTTIQEEDALFEAASDVPTNELGQDRVFDEDSGSAWAGNETDIEDLGVAMTNEPREVSSQADDGMFDIDADDDLILIDSEADMNASGAGLTSNEEINYDLGAPEESEEAGDPEADYNTVDFDREQTPEGEWAPVASDYDGEDDYEEEVAEQEEGNDEEVDPDYSDYEDAYYDETDPNASGDPRRSRAPMLLAAAAMIMIAAGGALWQFRKDLFGPGDKANPPSDVIKVDRPKTAGVVPVKDPKTNTDPVVKDPNTNTDPVAKDPTNDPKVNTDPIPKDPTNDPKVNTDPVAKDPVAHTDPVAKDPESYPKQTIDRNLRPDGETLRIGGLDETMVSEGGMDLMERHLRSVVQTVNGLEMGVQALAQLRNENIFVGRVKALNSTYVTLATKAGEVTLARADLRALTTLENTDVEDWRNVTTTGLIKLRNSNRLKGKIVEARNDSVILMVNANRVIIPRSAIESVSEERRDVNTVSEEEIESDDWFRELVEKKIRNYDENRAKRSAEIRAQATTKSPTLDLVTPKKPKPTDEPVKTPDLGLPSGAPNRGMVPAPIK